MGDAGLGLGPANEALVAPEEEPPIEIGRGRVVFLHDDPRIGGGRVHEGANVVALVGRGDHDRVFLPGQAAVGRLPPGDLAAASIARAFEQEANRGGRFDDHVAVLGAGLRGDGRRLLPGVAEPAGVSHRSRRMPVEDVGCARLVHVAHAVVDLRRARVVNERQVVGRLLGHRNGQLPAGGVLPGAVPAVHLHVVDVQPLLVVADRQAGVVDVHADDRVALAAVEPRVPRVADVGVVALGLELQDGDRRRERPAVVGRLLIDPVAAVRSMPVEEVDVAVVHLHELAVGAKRGNVVEDLPLGDIARPLRDGVHLPPRSGRAEVVAAQQRRPAVPPKHDVHVAVMIDEQRRPTVVVHLAAVGRLGIVSQGAHAGLERSRPAVGRVVVRTDVGVFVRALVGDEGFSVGMLGAGMLEVAHRVVEAVVGEVVDVGGDRRRGQHDRLQDGRQEDQRINAPVRHGHSHRVHGRRECR